MKRKRKKDKNFFFLVRWKKLFLCPLLLRFERVRRQRRRHRRRRWQWLARPSKATRCEDRRCRAEEEEEVSGVCSKRQTLRGWERGNTRRTKTRTPSELRKRESDSNFHFNRRSSLSVFSSAAALGFEGREWKREREKLLSEREGEWERESRRECEKGEWERERVSGCSSEEKWLVCSNILPGTWTHNRPRPEHRAFVVVVVDAPFYEGGLSSKEFTLFSLPLSSLLSLSPPPSHSHSLTHSLSSLLSLTPSHTHTHAHVFLWSTQVEKRVLIKACFKCELFAREREREREGGRLWLKKSRCAGFLGHPLTSALSGWALERTKTDLDNNSNNNSNSQSNIKQLPSNESWLKLKSCCQIC